MNIATRFLKLITLVFLWPHLLFGVPPPPGRAPWTPFVSGDAFRAYCDYVFDEEDRSLNPASVKPNSTIFVKTDYLGEFFDNIHPYIPYNYILVSHNSDLSAPNAFASFLEDEKIIAWFAQNIDNNTNPKLHPIPIGIANPCWTHGNGTFIKQAQANPSSKKNLLYVNFTIETFPLERSIAYHLLTQASFSYCAKPKPFEDYLKELSSCHFVASPRGNGLDTHRLWESLYVGSYPLVKSSSLDPLYVDLPVIILQDWNQVTEEFLHEKYTEFGEKLFCLDKLYMPYWENLIDSYKKTLR